MGKAAKVYYTEQNQPTESESNRLYPAPMVSIEKEPVYANDNIIGYNYLIKIEGYATSLDKRNVQEGVVYDFKDTMSSIDSIKKLLFLNGGNLVVNTDDDVLLFKCYGGTIRNFSVNETDNNWFNYASYTAEIEFNDVDFSNCDGSEDFTPCTDISGDIQNPVMLLDMKKYKVKSFNDSFTLDIQEGNLNNQTNTFNLTYSISATGKHYFDANYQLLPAWEQAKKFVEYKIKKQVGDFISNTVLEGTSDVCTTLGKTADLYQNSNTSILEEIDVGGAVSIHNETLSFAPSESEGSFSSTYSCLIRFKKTDNSDGVSDGDFIHTYTKNQTTNNNGSKKDVSITVNGTVQGLVTTGIIGQPNLYEMSGNFINHKDPATAGSKYEKALSGYGQIVTGNNLNSDIMQEDQLNITYESLGLNLSEFPCLSGDPLPASISTSHNYTTGSIDYTVNYSTDSACSLGGSGSSESGSFDWTNFSVNIDDAVDIIAEFVVPGRAAGPIIQKIGGKTAKKISINVEGASSKLVGGGSCCPPSGSGEDNPYANLGGCDIDTSLLPSGVQEILSYEISGMKLTSDQLNINTKDGSYSISKSFTEWCCDE